MRLSISRSRWRAIRYSLTAQAGLDQIERKVNLILDKFVDMDMATTWVNSTPMTLDKTLKHVSAVSANLEQFTGQQSTQQLPASLNQSLKRLRRRCRPMMPVPQTNQELRQSVQSLNQLMSELQPLVHSLNEQPSSLIFDRALVRGIPRQARKMMKKRMLTLAWLGLLAGCGSAPTTLRYYSLDADTAPSSVTTAQPQHQLVCCARRPVRSA